MTRGFALCPKMSRIESHLIFRTSSRGRCTCYPHFTDEALLNYSVTDFWSLHVEPILKQMLLVSSHILSALSVSINTKGFLSPFISQAPKTFCSHRSLHSSCMAPATGTTPLGAGPRKWQMWTAKQITHLFASLLRLSGGILHHIQEVPEVTCFFTHTIIPPSFLVLPSPLSLLSGIIPQRNSNSCLRLCSRNTNLKKHGLVF